jgi:hypothetical protein
MNQRQELRRIVWTEIFPFIRLFQSFQLAKRPERLAVALAAVLVCYVVGRTMDAIWIKAGYGLPASTAAVTASVHPGAAALEALMGRHADAILISPTSIPSASTIGPFDAALTLGRHTLDAVAQSAAGVFGGQGPGLLHAFEGVVRGKFALLSERPFFFFLFGFIALTVFAFAAAVISRQVAIESTRGEHLSLGQAMQFARDFWFEYFAAPLFVGAILSVGFLLLWVGGLIGAIPGLGQLVIGLGLPIALVIGFVLALTLIGATLGSHLMWPTLAVECSDKFDAVSHAFSYVGRRPWNLAFYGALTAIYGGLCYIMVRAIAFLTLKITHAGLAATMGVGGADGEGLRKLERMWAMPDWSAFSIIPGAGAPLYGDLFRAENLGFFGNVGAGLIALWVFIVVGLVAAFAFSFWIAASVQMYLLLRRDVDQMEYHEVFYEQTPVPADVAAAKDDGQSLPVVPPNGA